MTKKKGYFIVDFDGTGMLQIEKDDTCPRFADDEEATEQAVKDGIKIIPVEELPDNFDADKKYFGWIDTPENRKTIQKYCVSKQKETKMGNNNEWFGQVRWCDEDLANALECADIEANEKNIATLRNAVNTHHFVDRMIEAGWDYINYTIEENAELMDSEWEGKR